MALNVMADHKVVKIFLGMILILVNSGCIFEKSGVRLFKEPVFNDPIKEFKIENASIRDVFFKLQNRDLPKILVEFWIEGEPGYKNKIPAKPINIDLKNTTVGEVVQEALRQDPRYTIKEINDYFVITQKELINKKDYILNRKIKHKFMENLMLHQANNVIRFWFRQHGININLGPENMSWDGTTPMSIDLRNRTLREVLIDFGKFYKSSIFVHIDNNSEFGYLFCGDQNKKHRRHNRP